MPTEFSGKHLLESMRTLQEKSANVISEVRSALNPMLNAQGKSLGSEESFASIVKDINKLTTVEKHINNGSLKDMRYVESGIFANSILPSNVVTINGHRSFFVEEGLLYILDFDTSTLKVTKKEVHKIVPLWNLCLNNNRVTLVVGEEILWVVPTHGEYILGLKGDGIFSSSGKIRYMKLPLEQDLVISDFKEWNRDIAFISNENRYYRINQVYDTEGWTADNWVSMSMNRCFATCICDGNLDYVGTQYGEVWKLDHQTMSFSYVTDTKNVTDYEDHYRDLIENRDAYPPILYMSKNDIQWNVLESPDKLYFSTSLDGESLDMPFESVDLPGSLSVGQICVNRISCYDRSIIYGYDNMLNTVAYSFRTAYDPIDIIELGSDELVPQWLSVDISDDRAVMIELYEHTIKASDYYTEEEISENEYSDFKYTSLVMRQADYTDYEFIFGPEFNPLFIPAFIKAEKGKTVVVDKGSTSLSFNIAYTSDQSHWNIVNLDETQAINVQDMDSGNGIFVLVGLQNDSVLISKNGYKWEKIKLQTSDLNLVSVVYNRHRNKFYAVNFEGTVLVEIDAVNMISKSLTLSGIATSNYITTVKNICSFGHDIIINAEANGKIKSYRTQSLETAEDILYQGLSEVSFKIFDPCDEYSKYQTSLVNTFEIADNIYSIHQVKLKWDENAVTDYDKSLLTGIVVMHPKFDRELSKNIMGQKEYRCAVFPYEPNKPICGMEYLNHVVLIQQQDKYFIPMNKAAAPICYHHNEFGKFFMVQVNGKCGCVGDGFFHVIQSHASNFTRISYIMSSDQSYSPVVTNVDLVDTKKHVRISEYALEYDYDNVDQNGNIEMYPVLISNFKDNYPGSIIRTDKFIRVGKGSVGYISDDGINWVEGFKMPCDGWWRDIVFNTNMNGESLYIAINFLNVYTSEIWYSNNLNTWEKATLPDVQFGWIELEGNGEMFVAVAHPNTNSKYIIYSLDGKVWTELMLDHAVDKVKCGINVDVSSFPTTPDLFVMSSIITPSNGRNVIFHIGPQGKEISTFEITSDGNLNMAISDMIGLACTDQDEKMFMPMFGVESGGKIGFMANIDSNLSNLKLQASLTQPLTNLYMSDVMYQDLTSKIIFYEAKKPYIYIVCGNETSDELSIPVRIDLPDELPERIGHPICYYDNKIYIGLATPIVIDLKNTIPDRIDGSFMVENLKSHYQSLPFTPDHVFLIGADSDSAHDKLFVGEMHREDVIGTLSGEAHAATIFNNTEESMKLRSDADNSIVDKGFVFTNRSNTDRLINFIAIKEDHYS